MEYPEKPLLHKSAVLKAMRYGFVVVKSMNTHEYSLVK